MAMNAENSPRLGRPTAEELLVISDYIVKGEIKDYETAEMKAAAERVGNLLAAVKDEATEIKPEDRHLGKMIISTQIEFKRPASLDAFEDQKRYLDDMQKYRKFLDSVDRPEEITIEDIPI